MKHRYPHKHDCSKIEEIKKEQRANLEKNMKKCVKEKIVSF